MRTRKPKVCLTHKTFGEVTVIDAWTTVSKDSRRYFVARNSEAFDGDKTLLANAEYWLSPADELEKVFLQFARDHEVAIRKKLQADHAKDRAAAKISLKAQMAVEAVEAAEAAETAETAEAFGQEVEYA